MDYVKEVFRYKIVNIEKLKKYGFVQDGEVFKYETFLPSSGFILIITINRQSNVDTLVIDPSPNEPYTLHLTDSVIGPFIGQVKSEYEGILEDISSKCFDLQSFTSYQSKVILEYIKNKYDDELEYLWPKFTNNAIIRRKDNKKWYFLIVKIPASKIGLNNDGLVEVIDIRMKKEDIDNLVDNVNFFLGYHMNKKSWISICLNDSVEINKICELIDESYKLANK